MKQKTRRKEPPNPSPEEERLRRKMTPVKEKRGSNAEAENKWKGTITELQKKLMKS
jgi:hypothetical protein